MRPPKSLVILYAISLGCVHGASIPLSGTAEELAARMELSNDEVTTRAVEGEILAENVNMLLKRSPIDWAHQLDEEKATFIMLIVLHFEEWIEKNDVKAFPDPQKDAKNYEEKAKGFWDKAEKSFAHGRGTTIKESILALFTTNGNSRATLELPPDAAIKAARKIINELKEKSPSDQKAQEKELADKEWESLSNMVGDSVWWGQLDSIYPLVEGYTQGNARKNARRNENILLSARAWKDMTNDQAIFIKTAKPKKKDVTWYSLGGGRRFPSKTAYLTAKPIWEKLVKEVQEKSESDREEAAKEADLPSDWEEIWNSIAPELDAEFRGLMPGDEDLSWSIDENGNMILDERAEAAIN
ncbi:hypothetical protein F4775DRAFT_589003 [Biscogniauxia sp. FL1348]|nr:hypothetical protein F4775DRAFT_589003 [Biscogniauxia sp. FL1348]